MTGSNFWLVRIGSILLAVAEGLSHKPLVLGQNGDGCGLKMQLRPLPSSVYRM